MKYKKHKCSLCEKETERGMYNSANKFVCSDCFLYASNLHLDTYEETEDGTIKIIQPYESYDEKNQRALFIDYAYRLFGNKLSKGAYRLASKYVADGMTYLGMLRALEWFYVVRRNPITKAKSNIGIIPYIYSEAQTYYTKENIRAYNQFKKSIEFIKQEQKETILEKDDVKRTNQLDMSNL
jgi:hypothetical protein